MPAFTSPDNIQYPVSTDPIVPLADAFKDLADDTQAALNSVRGDFSTIEVDDLADVNITSPVDRQVLTYDNSSSTWVNATPSGFTAQEKITADDATWTVPALASPIVKVTVIAGGGGGGGGQGDDPSPLAGNGGTGGTSVFGVGEAWAISASGGAGGIGGGRNVSGQAATLGFSAGNMGHGGQMSNSSESRGGGGAGAGGAIQTGYVDLTGVTTLNIQIGAGGAGGTAGYNGKTGSAGGRGEVIVEYVAV